MLSKHTYLQARVELQEVKSSVLLVEILHSPCTHVAHHLGQPHGSLSGHQQVSLYMHACKSTLTISISLKRRGSATDAGASSMIFWCLRCTEQSRPNKEMAFPYSSARICTSMCRALERGIEKVRGQHLTTPTGHHSSISHSILYDHTPATPPYPVCVDHCYVPYCNHQKFT